MRTPTRVSADELQRLAFDNPSAEIELDTDLKLAFLTIGRTDYVATYSEATTS